MHLDGFRNLWIVKPGAKSRGRGIQVMNKLEDIIQKITATNTNDPRFVVQKYIGEFIQMQINIDISHFAIYEQTRQHCKLNSIKINKLITFSVRLQILLHSTKISICEKFCLAQ